MASVFVEARDGAYVALENKAVICEGKTQAECAERAHAKHPKATIFGERIRHTDAGSPDEWRVLHHPSS